MRHRIAPEQHRHGHLAEADVVTRLIATVAPSAVISMARLPLSVRTTVKNAMSVEEFCDALYDVITTPNPADR